MLIIEILVLLIGDLRGRLAFGGLGLAEGLVGVGQGIPLGGRRRLCGRDEAQLRCGVSLRLIKGGGVGPGRGASAVRALRGDELGVVQRAGGTVAPGRRP